MIVIIIIIIIIIIKSSETPHTGHAHVSHNTQSPCMTKPTQNFTQIYWH